jgi:hypothetical protein
VLIVQAEKETPVRTLTIVGLTAAALTALVSAHAAPQEPSPQVSPVLTFDPFASADMRAAIAEINRLPQTCVDMTGIARDLDETTSVNGVELRCVRTYGDGLKPQGARWIIISPPISGRANIVFEAPRRQP